jgi:3-oxoadipate enol-lactonase
MHYSHDRVLTDDGLEVAIHRTGAGTPLLFLNGIGVHHEGISPLLDGLVGGHDIVVPDYRCMGDSPFPGRTPDMTIGRHARDMVAVLDHLGWAVADVAGWSMGVPVGLELMGLVPDRVRSFVAMFGSPGRPFEHGFPPPVSRALRLGFTALRSLPGLAHRGMVLSQLLPDVALGLMQGVAFVGQDVHRDAFLRQVAGVALTPKEPYFQALLDLADHDAWGRLPEIRCRTLVIAGEGDWLTPADTAREMARRIPGAKLLVYPRLSHFGLIERPGEIAREIRCFLDE